LHKEESKNGAFDGNNREDKPKIEGTQKEAKSSQEVKMEYGQSLRVK